jgi:hypothetical protein
LLKTRWFALLCLGLAVTLGVAGCHSAPPSAAGHPSSQATARDSLVSSVTTLATTTYAISLTTPRWSANGVVDPVGDSVTVTTHGQRSSGPITVETLTLAEGSWAKIDLGAAGPDLGIDPDKWLRLDSARLPAGSLPFDQGDLADAFDLNDVLSGITSVTRSDSQHYAGTIDLTGVRGVTSMVPAGSGLGSAATSLPFSATTDPQGRLIDIKVGSAAGFDCVISDYSAPSGIQRPDDNDTIAAPASAYSLLRADRT